MNILPSLGTPSGASNDSAPQARAPLAGPSSFHTALRDAEDVPPEPKAPPAALRLPDDAYRPVEDSAAPVSPASPKLAASTLAAEPTPPALTAAHVVPRASTTSPTRRASVDASPSAPVVAAKLSHESSPPRPVEPQGASVSLSPDDDIALESPALGLQAPSSKNGAGAETAVATLALPPTRDLKSEARPVSGSTASPRKPAPGSTLASPPSATSHVLLPDVPPAPAAKPLSLAPNESAAPRNGRQPADQPRTPATASSTASTLASATTTSTASSSTAATAASPRPMPPAGALTEADDSPTEPERGNADVAEALAPAGTAGQQTPGLAEAHLSAAAPSQDTKPRGPTRALDAGNAGAAASSSGFSSLARTARGPSEPSALPSNARLGDSSARQSTAPADHVGSSSADEAKEEGAAFGKSASSTDATTHAPDASSARHPTEDARRATSDAISTLEPTAAMSDVGTSSPTDAQSNPLPPEATVSTDGSLTPAPRRAAGGLTAPNTRATDAQVSAANLSVLRQTARAEVVVGDLGRISVTASTAGAGGMGVVIATARSSTAETLSPHVSAITADIRSANIPVQQVNVGGPSSPSTGHSDRGTSSSAAEGDTGGRGEKSPRDTSPSTVDSITPAASPARVRIVL